MSKGRKLRSPDQIRNDRAEIARMYLQGSTQAQIGAKLGLSRQQIGYDLDAVRQEWLQSSLIDFNQKKAEELARIDAVEREYWAAWQQSKHERQTSSIEQVKDPRGDKLKAGIRNVAQTGDPRYLEGVRWCIAKRCEVLGLNAPQKIAPTMPDGQRPYQLIVKEMSDEELAFIERLAERHHQLIAVSGASSAN
jgi:hypothetical protein